MNGKTASLMMLGLLVLDLLALGYTFQPAEASEAITIRSDGAVNPPNAPIYTADNTTYALLGNITAGADGIVIERDNVVIDGAGHSLTGSGGGNGTTLTNVFNVTVRNMIITNFTYGISLGFSSGNALSGNNIQNDHAGIELYSSSNNVLSDNSVTANLEDGIGLLSSSNNVLSDNSVTANLEDGIGLLSSSNNTLSHNRMVGNGYNLDVDGSSLSDFLQSVDTSNVADGAPIYYFVNQSDILVDPDAYPEVGYLGFVNCANVTVQGLSLRDNGQGLLLAYTSGSRISGNNITTNYQGIVLASCFGNTLTNDNVTANSAYGIVLYSSSDNILSDDRAANNEVGIVLKSSSENTLTGNDNSNNVYGIGFDSSFGNDLTGNTVANNLDGFVLYNSSDNNVFHNNLVNNTIHVYSESSNNAWDDGYPSGGNYWNDYQGTDVFRGPYQNETGSDGIGDRPFVIDGNNIDKFPLMKSYPWAAHDVGLTIVVTSKDIVGQRYDASISLMIFNYGNDSENVNATIYANQTAIGEAYDVQLTIGNFTVVPFTWNTTGFSKGNYTVSARLEHLPSDTDTSDKTFADGSITVTIPGDLDGDLQVQRADLVILSKAYGSRQGDLKWNPNADINGNGIVGLSDLVILAQHYGEQ